MAKVLSDFCTADVESFIHRKNASPQGVYKILKERRKSPTTLGCSTNSKNPKHPVSKHETNMYIDAKEARNTKSHRKTFNTKDYT